MYGLITLAIAYVDLIFGLLVSRHIRDFCEINDAWPFLIYILIHIVALAAKILVNRFALRYLERYLFISSSLLVLWLCAIEKHQSTASMNYLLFIVTVLGWYTFFTLMDGYAKRLKFWPVMFVFAAMYVLFLCYGALIPLILSNRIATLWVFLDSTLYLLIAVIVPAWVLQVELSKRH